MEEQGKEDVLRKQQPIASQDRLTPEFMQWLKQNNVTRRQLKREPAALDRYHQEWMKTKKRTRARRPSLLQMIPSISDIDLGTVVNNVQIAKDLFKTYRELQGLGLFKRNGAPWH
ncbi:hypothetical protein EDM59_20565 [Brevibacillus nitrificans]|uniref:Uncharacterized protein n=1 Tax=Brevibacillus nitrificans TaxID=651560 RepID=A0A3M8D533_9BACL|nr:hypothetical protein EDM59_20565 [Brevibacillus nitrificans]